MGDKVLLPVTLSPLILLVLLFVLGRIGSHFFDVTGVWREGIAFVLGTTLSGLLLWQVLLTALVLRFWRATR